MPKKYADKNDGKYQYKRISLALSPEEYELWTSQHKNKGFDTLTAMVRHSVNKLFDEIPDPENKSTTSNKETQELKKLVVEIKKEQMKSKEEFLSLNRQMLKLLANGKAHSENIEKITIRDKLYTLVKEKSRSLEELKSIIGAEERTIMHHLSMLEEKGFIFFNRQKWEWGA